MQVFIICEFILILENNFYQMQWQKYTCKAHVFIYLYTRSVVPEYTSGLCDLAFTDLSMVDNIIFSK